MLYLDLAAKTDHVPAQLELLRLSEKHVQRLRASVRAQPTKKSRRLSGESFSSTAEKFKTSNGTVSMGNTTMRRVNSSGSKTKLRGVSTATGAMLTRAFNSTRGKMASSLARERSDGERGSFLESTRDHCVADLVWRPPSTAGDIAVHNYCGQKNCHRC